MRSRLFLECPPNAGLFSITGFFTVDRKSSRTKTFFQNMIYMFISFFSKIYNKKNYLLSYNPLNKHLMGPLYSSK